MMHGAEGIRQRIEAITRELEHGRIVSDEVRLQLIQERSELAARLNIPVYSIDRLLMELNKKAQAAAGDDKQIYQDVLRRMMQLKLITETVRDY